MRQSLRGRLAGTLALQVGHHQPLDVSTWRASIRRTHRKIREIIDSGVIGQVISIQADEFVGPFVSSILFRGSWRRLRKFSGGAMLEKCCHDMDLINWMAGSRPIAVHAFASRPRGSRSMTIVGSRGTLWGYIDEMKVFHATTGARETVEHPVQWDNSGHGGGDRTHAFAFLDAVHGRRAQPAAGTWEGYLSAMVCFAADRSLQDARRVNLDYAQDGLVSLR